jgi:hypothetical protein
MSIIMEINPFEFFTDTQGDALDAGYIYIGEPNKDPRQYPVSAYYDAALTIPVAMPLRTSNGYIVRNGGPTFLYISGNYSILVQNKKNQQIYYVADFLMIGTQSAISASDLLNSTAPAKGAGMSGFGNDIDYPDSTVGAALNDGFGSQIPIERLGGSATPGHDNSPAFTAYANMLSSNKHATLLLRGGVYECYSDIVFDRPPKIVGVGGGVFQVGRETDGSYVADYRPSTNSFFFKLTQGAIPGVFTCGVLEDFTIMGRRGITSHYGVNFDDVGWNIATRNFSIINFAKTGLLTFSMNDADHLGMKILACGGLVDGVAYYALDNGPHYIVPPSAGATTNLQTFLRLHVEHCRFMARINGFAQKFIGSHFEMFTDSIISAGYSPLSPIDLGYSGPANAFIGTTFVDVGYKTYADLVPDGVAPTPALKLALVPYLIGSTATITGDPVFEGWKFSTCDFATADAAKYIDLPGHTVYLSDCTAGRAFVYSPGFNLGPGSKVHGGRMHGAVPNVSSDAVFGPTVGIKAGPIISLPTTGIPTDVSNVTLWWSTGSSNVANVTDITPNAVVGGVRLGAYLGNTIASGYTKTLSDDTGSFLPEAFTVRTAGGTPRRTRLTPGNFLTDTSTFVTAFDGYPSNGIRMGTDAASIQLTPVVTTSSYLGTPAIPWSNGYIQTAFVITSDRDSKQQITSINEAALRAWGKIEYCQYKLNDSVEVKGDGARWHLGLIAQDIQDAFASEGLDAFEYGLLCYDEWEEQPKITDENGAVVQAYQASGKRYGVRYEEAMALECAYLRSKLN